MTLRERIVSTAPIIAGAFLFCLSFFQIASVVCIGLLVFVWLLNFGIFESIKKVFRDKVLIIFLIYYFLHAVGLFYSANQHYGFLDLQTKLGFLIFPFLLSGFSFSSNHLQQFKRVFTAGAITACLLCLLHSVVAYSHDNDFREFFYVRYSYILHPAYFTIYLNLAALFVLENTFKTKKEALTFSRMNFLILIFLFLNIILLSSRTAMAAAFLTTLIYLVILFIEKKNRKTLIIFSVAFIFITIVIQLLSIKLYDRFSQINEAVQHQSAAATTTQTTQEENGVNVRMHLWKNALHLIRESPLMGVGTGDIKDELANTYRKSNLVYGVENNYNPHNQFLHTAVTLGFTGLILLLLLLLTPFIYFIKNREWVYALFMFLICINGLTESVLERQAGIIYFTFFCLLGYWEVKNRNFSGRL